MKIEKLDMLTMVINEVLRASHSNRVLSLRRSGLAEELQVTVYDPDRGMYYAGDYDLKDIIG